MSLQIQAAFVGYRNKRGQFSSLEDSAEDALRTSAKQAMEDGAKLAAQLSPVGRSRSLGSTGRGQESRSISRSWRWSFEGNTGTIENVSPHFIFYWKGTAPHEIRAKRAKVLAFPGPNGTIFAKRVHHPGTPPHPIDDVLSRKLRPELERAGNKAAAQTRVRLVELLS